MKMILTGTLLIAQEDNKLVRAHLIAQEDNKVDKSTFNCTRWQ